MKRNITGIHHVTAIASDPQRNLDFYTQVLGLRLVKLTVNYDVPDTYHFYLADGAGNPGTILTFFQWPDTPRGIPGTGQAASLSFSIAAGAIGYWMNRLKSHDLAVSTPFRRFDEEGFSFQDPDGLQIELIAGQAESKPVITDWLAGPVPVEMALRGFHSVTLSEESIEGTAGLLMEAFGFLQTDQSGNRVRFKAQSDQPGRKIDLVIQPDAPPGRMGTGIIHHVAWRASDDAEQLAWREELISQGLNVTQVINRRYFHSIYFHEPGGVQFEIATDPPGFTLDEDLDCLGTSLTLPPWLEPKRPEITQLLPVLQLPVSCPEPA